MTIRGERAPLEPQTWRLTLSSELPRRRDEERRSERTLEGGLQCDAALIEEPATSALELKAFTGLITKPAPARARTPTPAELYIWEPKILPPSRERLKSGSTERDPKLRLLALSLIPPRVPEQRR